MPCDAWCSKWTCDQFDCNSCGRWMCERPEGWKPGLANCHSYCNGFSDPAVCLTIECMSCNGEHGCPDPAAPPPPPNKPAPPPIPPTACAPPGRSAGYPNCIVPEWRCCTDPALQCFRKGGMGQYGYGQCRESCPGGDWDCEVVRKMSPPSPPLPAPSECSGYIARYGTCLDSPMCCSPGDGCFRRPHPTTAAICRPLSPGLCEDTDEWVCPDSWIFWTPLPSPPPPPHPAAQNGVAAPAATGALTAWLGMSETDQWAAVAIFGVSGLLLLTGYGWCTARARRNASGARRMLDVGTPAVSASCDGGEVVEERGEDKLRGVEMRHAACAA